MLQLRSRAGSHSSRESGGVFAVKSPWLRRVMESGLIPALCRIKSRSALLFSRGENLMFSIFPGKGSRAWATDIRARPLSQISGWYYSYSLVWSGSFVPDRCQISPFTKEKKKGKIRTRGAVSPTMFFGNVDMLHVSSNWSNVRAPVEKLCGVFLLSRFRRFISAWWKEAEIHESTKLQWQFDSSSKHQLRLSANREAAGDSPLHKDADNRGKQQQVPFQLQCYKATQAAAFCQCCSLKRSWNASEGGGEASP